MPEMSPRIPWPTRTHRSKSGSKYRLEGFPTEVDFSRRASEEAKTPSLCHQSSLNSLKTTESGKSNYSDGSHTSRISLKKTVKKLGRQRFQSFWATSSDGLDDGFLDLPQIYEPQDVLSFESDRVENANLGYSSRLNFGNSPEPGTPHSIYQELRQIHPQSLHYRKESEIGMSPPSAEVKPTNGPQFDWDTAPKKTPGEGSKTECGSMGAHHEESSGDEALLETIHALHCAADRMKKHRGIAAHFAMTSTESSVTLDLARKERVFLPKITSKPVLSIKPKSLALPSLNDLTTTATSQNDPSSSNSTEKLGSDKSPANDKNAVLPTVSTEDGSDRCEDLDDDRSSLNTLDSSEPDYFSFPVILPKWPVLPTYLRGPFTH